MKYIRLLRLPNLLMVALTMYLMRFCIIQPMLGINNFTLQLAEFDFFILVMATVLLTAGGYVINDYFDTRTDLLNHPETVVVGKTLHRRIAIRLHLILNIIGITAGFYVSCKIQLKSLGFIFIFVSGILWFYSTNYKRQFLIGNIIVSILSALVPLMVFLYELPLLNKVYGQIMLANHANFNYLLYWGLGYAFFAFLTTLNREIIKDVEDFEGDRAYGMNTLPVNLGIGKSKWIIGVLSGIIILAIGFTYVKYLLIGPAGIDYATLFYFTILLVQPMIFLIVKLVKANTKKDYHFISSLQKYVMLLGILYAVLVRFLIEKNF
ncbi:MAG: geranylgeranylglycerol-phosphate geranylgeranyltransferase [Bacteroidales bacterium]|nr:geranylgeranylglycerol-phosphate geranylgeranyltransferase [Bacteroidales bacterium]